ncbi:MAG TPA: carboxypeptidase-like regulatory domain-containing protein [Verrucomicrobiae bacterium]|nr:carboxypeptidase-like regulatory domain-containing protein [Verrucomicrobiae bacterium]
MSTETTFTRRWKRPSRAFVLVIVITIIGLFISFGLPSLVIAKFSNQPTTLLFQVRVMDDQGIPIPNANVFVSSASAQTDLEGYAAVPNRFLAKGIKNLTGTCRLRGDLRVEAPGYISWRKPLTDLFGSHYNYVDKGTNVAHEVTLLR